MKTRKQSWVVFTVLCFCILLATAAAPGRIVISAKAVSAAQQASASGFYNVKTFGATGDGKTLDSPAINKAIADAAAAGGGTVFFPAGTYLSVFSRAKSLCISIKARRFWRPIRKKVSSTIRLNRTSGTSTRILVTRTGKTV